MNFAYFYFKYAKWQLLSNLSKSMKTRNFDNQYVHRINMPQIFEEIYGFFGSSVEF